MRKADSVVDKNEEPRADNQDAGPSTGFGKVKNMIADKLHHVAEAHCEKEADPDAQSGGTRYGKQASEWLDRSAEFIRQFDHEQADARVRECIGQNPGRSLLIAGGVGLIIGTVLRRR